MPAKCCPAPCTFKARAEGLAQLKPAQAASCVWCPLGRQRTDPAVFIAVDDLNLYYGNAGTAALALKYKTFRRKTYLPKACNFHVQMPGSLNCRMKHARRMFTRCGLGAALLAARWVWPWEAKKEKFHTCGGPRRRPCLGQGRGRRILVAGLIHMLHPTDHLTSSIVEPGDRLMASHASFGKLPTTSSGTGIDFDGSTGEGLDYLKLKHWKRMNTIV